VPRVQGLKNFSDFFEDYNNDYVIIGGTAADITLEENDLSFRATKETIRGTSPNPANTAHRNGAPQTHCRWLPQCPAVAGGWRCQPCQAKTRSANRFYNPGRG